MCHMLCFYPSGIHMITLHINVSENDWQYVLWCHGGSHVSKGWGISPVVILWLQCHLQLGTTGDIVLWDVTVQAKPGSIDKSHGGILAREGLASEVFLEKAEIWLDIVGWIRASVGGFTRWGEAGKTKCEWKIKEKRILKSYVWKFTWLGYGWRKGHLWCKAGKEGCGQAVDNLFSHSIWVRYAPFLVTHTNTNIYTHITLLIHTSVFRLGE